MNLKQKIKLFTVPTIIYPLLGIDSMGDAEEASPITMFCYRQDNAEVVINSLGNEERSGTQIYLPGESAEAVQADDLVSCGELIRRRIIKKQTFYLPGGIIDIVVLFLP